MQFYLIAVLSECIYDHKIKPHLAYLKVWSLLNIVTNVIIFIGLYDYYIFLLALHFFFIIII